MTTENEWQVVKHSDKLWSQVKHLKKPHEDPDWYLFSIEVWIEDDCLVVDGAPESRIPKSVIDKAFALEAERLASVT